jgi:hypothetical protein
MKIGRQFLLVISFLTLPIGARASIAQVTKIHGEVTFLASGMKEAKRVVGNQWLDKDTSILSQDKSFVVLKYKNGSSLTLGPNSKIVIDQTPNKELQVYSLLMGKMKAVIRNQNQTQENKAIIRTKNSALGIRGTEFQVGYSPDSKITSLVTFHGAVAMVKLSAQEANEVSLNDVEKKLKETTIEVKTGEYSGVSQNLKLATSPVKISPEQFTKLKLAETLGAVPENISDATFKTELASTISEYQKTSTDDTKVNNDVFTPKAGGYVDIVTGIYLAPLANAELDKKMNIYIPTEKMGKINEDGNYIPPEGLAIDPKKGFVVVSKTASIDKLNQAQELNAQVKIQVPAKNTEIKRKKNKLDNLEEDIYKKYYDPEKI